MTFTTLYFVHQASVLYIVKYCGIYIVFLKNHPISSIYIPKKPLPYSHHVLMLINPTHVHTPHM